MRRFLLVMAAAAMPVAAQTPMVRLMNATRPASRDFQIGDRFEVLITGAPNQAVSVRTTMHGRMDWGPVIGRTDTSGRWSATGKFEKSDFGDWSEVWTVGGKLVNPAVHFSVDAPCVKGGEGYIEQTGCCNRVLMCETAEGQRTFATPSITDPFRTPDGRLIAGRMGSNMTAEEYRAQIMEHLITSGANADGSGRFGDDAGKLILKVIGVNALSGDEIRNVLAIVRAAFSKPERIPQGSKEPSGTLVLLGNLANSTGEESLKQEIAETVRYVQTR